MKESEDEVSHASLVDGFSVCPTASQETDTEKEDHQKFRRGSRLVLRLARGQALRRKISDLFVRLRAAWVTERATEIARSGELSLQARAAAGAASSESDVSPTRRSSALSGSGW